MKKNITALILLYLFQFIGACVQDDYPECDCSGTALTEVEIVGLNTDTREMVGDSFYETQEIGESVLKADFILALDLKFTEKEIFTSAQKRHSWSFGFQAAYACTCAVPYSVTKQVERIEIFGAELDSSNFVNISGAFMVLDFFDNEGFFTLTEAVEATRQAENAQSFIPRYQLKIVDEAAIPQNAVFKVMVTLSDGTELQQETSLITFE